MGNGLSHCFSGGGSRRFEVAAVTWEPCDEGVGHSFRYVRPDSEVSSSFRCISGAAVSANVSTALSTSLLLDVPGPPSAASAFESSTSFSSVALQTATEQGFMSGPLERGFTSGPIDRRARLFSGPIETPSSLSAQLRRSRRASARSLFRGLGRAMTLAVSAAANGRGAIVAPIKGRKDSNLTDVEAAQWPDSPDSLNGNLHWAQGKAGEDRVHVVVSEEHGWLFVGIYDGFNGPDATDFLLSNLYATVHRELKGLLSEDKEDTSPSPAAMDEHRRKPRVATKNRDANHRRRRSDFERKTTEANHSRVLKALYRALRSTEDCFLDIADKMVSENPELALMGSCVLVMLMKGDDVYLMNVGDSRAILARNAEEPDLWSIHEETLFDLEAQNDANPSLDELPSLSALQLTSDHSTSVEEEVRRIRNAHPDDTSSVSNDRVKGSLRVTRAFGAGFLKQPKWNNALLEMFRIDYVGTSPYITCNPSLHHHKLGPRDRFLILSSDGLYQYFTNQEAVAQVEMFMATTPEGDPAQHLAEEVLLRAATQAGMDFHELLEIPRGDRRRYHDDISIIVISLEGGLWRSCM